MKLLLLSLILLGPSSALASTSPLTALIPQDVCIGGRIAMSAPEDVSNLFFLNASETLDSVSTKHLDDVHFYGPACSVQGELTMTLDPAKKGMVYVVRLDLLRSRKVIWSTRITGKVKNFGAFESMMSTPIDLVYQVLVRAWQAAHNVIP